MPKKREVAGRCQAGPLERRAGPEKKNWRGERKRGKVRTRNFGPSTQIHLRSSGRGGWGVLLAPGQEGKGVC